MPIAVLCNASSADNEASKLSAETNSCGRRFIRAQLLSTQNAHGFGQQLTGARFADLRRMALNESFPLDVGPT